jgi:hypothetical protein
MRPFLFTADHLTVPVAAPTWSLCAQAEQGRVSASQRHSHRTYLAFWFNFPPYLFVIYRLIMIGKAPYRLR